MKKISLMLATLAIGGLSIGAYAQGGTTATATGGGNHSFNLVPQLNIGAPQTSVQLPINVLGNQQAAQVSNQTQQQSNQSSLGNAGAAAGGGLLGGAVAPVGNNDSYQKSINPTYISQHGFFDNF